MRCGDYQSAVDVLRRVVEREPTFEAQCLLASSYLELGEYDSALRHASVAVESDPSSAGAPVIAMVGIRLRRQAARNRFHADDADLTLNLWITPDSANLDPSTGGIVVWNQRAPKDWSFDDYNSGGDRVREFPQSHNAEPTVVPYRANRAVLFEGHLFHRTDGFTFARGFTNRRRNLTFLFQRGRR